jgi:hypothetical protein
VHLDLWPSGPLPSARPYDPLRSFGPPITIPAWGIEEWEDEAAQPVRVQTWPKELQPRAAAVVDQAIGRLASGLGTASLVRVADDLKCAMHWAVNNYDEERGPFEPFGRAVASTVWRRFKRRFGWRNLRLEKDDEHRRNAAVLSEAAVAPYLERVERFTRRWLAWRQRRTLAAVGADPRFQDQVFAVVGRVLELLRSESPAQAFKPYLRVGKPAFFAIRDRILYEQRRRERIQLVDVPVEFVQGHAASPVTALQKRQADHALDHLYSDLRPHLSKRYQRFLDVMCVELTDGPVWGLQQRVADYLGCSKSRVSEAVSRMREVAHQVGLGHLLLDVL